MCLTASTSLWTAITLPARWGLHHQAGPQWSTRLPFKTSTTLLRLTPLHLSRTMSTPLSLPSTNLTHSQCLPPTPLPPPQPAHVLPSRWKQLSQSHILKADDRQSRLTPHHLLASTPLAPLNKTTSDRIMSRRDRAGTLRHLLLPKSPMEIQPPIKGHLGIWQEGEQARGSQWRRAKTKCQHISPAR